MLTLFGTNNDENTKNLTEYYYSQPYHHNYYHHYHPVSFINDSNNSHHSSIYETNPYYTLSPSGYSHHPHDENSNHLLLNSTYPQQYSSEGHTNEIFYPPGYEYNPSNYAEPVNCNSNNTTDYSSLDGACQSDSIIVELINRQLWLKFAAHTHENVLTKAGRRMFPTLKFKVHGLKPNGVYKIYIEMILMDDNHWKFNSGKWIPSGHNVQCHKTNHQYHHPDSPNTGTHWMKSENISFEYLKLTNNKQLTINNRQNQTKVLLNSMHKYIPRLTIIEIVSTESSLSNLEHIFTFPETQFIAVTAYQNTDITQLKIDNNPFAKGFRDSSLSPPYNSGNDVTYDYYEPKKKKRCQ